MNLTIYVVHRSNYTIDNLVSYTTGINQFTSLAIIPCPE